MTPKQLEEFMLLNRLIEDVHSQILPYEKIFHNAVRTCPDGLILEFGVYEGGSLRRIAGLTSRTVYGFDSFRGLPECWNGLPINAFETQIPKFAESNIELVVGLYQDTLPVFLETHTEPVAFMHIDCDLYSSTKCVLDHFKPRFQNGSIIAFDELIQYSGWEDHEFRAFAEFLSDTGYQYECIGRYGTHQVAFRLII